ncbi:MAG: hypothetical protein O2780_08305 [Proteobacteria bacterium]|jgi:hypothetical protein|nr:hypothetical protein [Pseudomonadota bacterium]MDA1300201.1 hypothetical protein [Pseudomonadota bacterium]
MSKEPRSTREPKKKALKTMKEKRAEKKDKGRADPILGNRKK